jgi:hypothetical protein
MAVDGDPLAPPWAHPAADQLGLGSAGTVLGGDEPDQRGHLCGPQAEGAGDLLGGAAVARSARTGSSSCWLSTPTSFID